MADRFVEAHIQRLPMFTGLPPEHLRLVADAATVRRFERGEVIFQQGQISMGLYLVVSGQGVLIQTQANGEQRQVGVVNPNQFLNETALYRQIYDTASLYANQPSIILILERDLFQNLLRLHPAITSNLHVQNQPTPPQPPLPPIQRKPEPDFRVQPSVQTPPSPVHNLPRLQPAPLPVTQPKPSVQPQTAPPEIAEFTGQRKGENVLIVTRRHWWAFLREIWKALVSAVTLFLLSSLVQSQVISLLLVLLMIFVPGLLLLYFYLDWRNDKMIVTDQRILRFERVIFPPDIHINEIPIKNIQMVRAELPAGDPFAHLFGYGDIVIKTAGDAGNVKFDFIPQPETTQEVIFRHRNTTAEQEIHQQNREMIRAELERVLHPGSLAAQPAQAAPQSPKPPPVAPGRLSTHFVDEENRTVYRKHLLIWLRGVFVPGVLIIGALFVIGLWLVVPRLREIGLIIPLICTFVIIAAGVWFYWSDWDWRHDIYVIGDETASIIHRRPLWLQDEDNKILINRIDSVAVNVQGFLQNMFNYGDVAISLVGDERPTYIRDVPNPREVQAEIARRLERARIAQREVEDRRRREDIANYLSVYHETLQQQDGNNLSNPPRFPK